MNINKSNVNIDYIEIGDHVRFQFNHYAPMSPEKVHDSGRIIQKIHRYGYVNDGQTPTKPLIRFISDVTGEERFSDSGFIVEILEKRKGPQLHYNFYRDELNKEYLKITHQSHGKHHYHGDLENIVAFALSQLTINIPRSLDHSRLLDDLWKQGFIQRQIIDLYWEGVRVGTVSSRFVKVQKKRLKRWLRQNVNRYLFTVKELEKIETSYNRDVEEDYWDFVEREFSDLSDFRSQTSIVDHSQINEYSQFDAPGAKPLDYHY